MRAFAATLGLLLLSAPAAAQTLARTGIEPVPVPLFTVGSSVEEPGGFVVHGRDLATNTARSIRVDGSNVSGGAGRLTSGIARCGGATFVLVYERIDAGRGARWRVQSGSGVTLHTLDGTLMGTRSVSLACIGRTPTLAWHDTTRAHFVSVSSAGPASERVIPLGPGPVEGMTWVGAGSDELYVVTRGRQTTIRRVGARGVVAERTLERSADIVLALSPLSLLSARSTSAGAVLQSFSRADLSPRDATVIPPSAPGRLVHVHGLSAGPREVAVVSVLEHWTGDDYVSIEQGPGEPDRFEPAERSAHTLRLWRHVGGQLGPPVETDRARPGAGAWVGAQLVWVQGAEPHPHLSGRFHTARVLRFELR